MNIVVQASGLRLCATETAAPQLKMILKLFRLIGKFESVFKLDCVSKEVGRGCRFTNIDVKTAGDNWR
jgi:hypothetical protein